MINNRHHVHYILKLLLPIIEIFFRAFLFVNLIVKAHADAREMRFNQQKKKWVDNKELFVIYRIGQEYTYKKEHQLTKDI